MICDVVNWSCLNGSSVATNSSYQYGLSSAVFRKIASFASFAIKLCPGMIYNHSIIQYGISVLSHEEGKCWQRLGKCQYQNIDINFLFFICVIKTDIHWCNGKKTDYQNLHIFQLQNTNVQNVTCIHLRRQVPIILICTGSIDTFRIHPPRDASYKI